MTRAKECATALAAISQALAQSLDPRVVAERGVASIGPLPGTRLSAFSRLDAASEPLATLLERIAESCGRLLRADGVGFGLVDGDELRMGPFWGDVPVSAVVPRVAIGEGLSGGVAASGALRCIADLRREAGPRPVDHDALIRLGYRSWLGVPLTMGQRVIGVLTIGSRSVRQFDPDEIAIAVALASQAAAAIENVRLYEATRAALDTLSRTQEQRVQAQKMEAMGRLAGGVAHDFNNLLTVILGRSQLLLSQLPGSDPHRRSVAVIERTASRAAALTAQLLAFGRKQVLQSRVLDLNEVIGDLMGLLEKLVREDVRMVFRPGACVGAIEADPCQLEQVVVNLVANARDAMPSGGTLTIETSEVELADGQATCAAGAYVMLTVTDTGLGMDPETRTRVFEPFFTTKEMGEGTGLGLATVYGIVKQSGGDVLVSSEPGRGTTFTVLLPRIEAGAGTAARQGDETLTGTETILLVEDDEPLRELAREVLQGAGYRVLEAVRPDDAADFALRRDERIDLLLTDVVMPGRSGLALARDLVLLQPDMRVLYMSGHADRGQDRAELREPGTFFIAKPFTPQALVARVRAALRPAARLLALAER